MRIGDRIKILGQDIYGKIVRLHPSEVVIFDEDLKVELCFKITEIEGVILRLLTQVVTYSTHY